MNDSFSAVTEQHQCSLPGSRAESEGKCSFETVAWCFG
jgi:hypothetical protein